MNTYLQSCKVRGIDDGDIPCTSKKFATFSRRAGSMYSVGFGAGFGAAIKSPGTVIDETKTNSAEEVVKF